MKHSAKSVTYRKKVARKKTDSVRSRQYNRRQVEHTHTHTLTYKAQYNTHTHLQQRLTNRRSINTQNLQSEPNKHTHLQTDAK
jgi:hypothetical protein